MEGKKADQIAYLTFPLGVLALVAHERGLPKHQSILQTFTKKALDFAGDKFDARDERIEGRPASWPNAAKLAALAARVSL